MIPPKTKALNNQRTRKKMNRYDKRSTEDSERNDRKTCHICENDYN